MIKTVKIREGQSLIDLALQLYGDATKIVDLCKLNPTTIPNVNTNNITGLTINYEVTSNEVSDYFLTNKVYLNSRYPETISGGGFSSGFSSGFNVIPKD